MFSSSFAKLVSKVVILLVLSSCVSTVEIPYLSKKLKKDKKVTISKKGAVAFEFKDCGSLLFIIPINLLENPERELERKCGNNWEAFDVVEKRSQFVIPILYGQYCVERRGLCKE